MAKASEIEIPSLLLAEQASAPTTPASGFGRLFAKSDGVYFVDDAGTVVGPFSTGGGGGGSGQVLQVVTATSTVDDTTMSSSLVDSSLSAAITPTASDSTLIVDVHGTVKHEVTGAASPARDGTVAIRNSTDAVLLTEGQRGRWSESNSGGDPHWSAIALRGDYTVNSTTARTFVLQHKRGGSSQITSTIMGTLTGGVLMTIWEIAA